MMIERTIIVGSDGIVDIVREDGTVCHPHGSIRLQTFDDTPAAKAFMQEQAQTLADAIDLEILNTVLPHVSRRRANGR